MKKGCALIVAVWILLVGAYGYVAWQRIHEWVPAVAIAVLGGTFASALVGSFAGLFTGARDRGALRRATNGEALRDGRLEAASGPIRPLGAPLEAPFTGRPCVAYEYDVKRPGADRSAFAGVGLAPCAIDTPRQSVRVLGWTVLDDFPRGGGAIDLARGTAYLQSVTFEPLGLTSIVSVLSELLTDDDGAIRKDFRISGEGIDGVDLEGHTIKERIVPVAEVVTLLGRWSEDKRGFAPTGATSINRLFPGDLGRTTREVRGTAVKTFATGLFMFLALHAILVPMYLLAPASGTPTSGSVWDERDCDRQKALLAGGANPNEIGASGLTPLMNAARLGETPCVQHLIEAGAQLEARDGDGDTALTQAILSGRDENIEILRRAGATDFRITAATGRPVTETSAPFGVVKDYIAAVHRGDFETMARLMFGASVQRMEERRGDLALWQSLRPKSPSLVDGWSGDKAATLTVRGSTPDGERRVNYHLETYQIEDGPGVWRIKKEWFPDVR